jgi:hypothetical protein
MEVAYMSGEQPEISLSSAPALDQLIANLFRSARKAGAGLSNLRARLRPVLLGPRQITFDRKRIREVHLEHSSGANAASGVAMGAGAGAPLAASTGNGTRYSGRWALLIGEYWRDHRVCWPRLSDPARPGYL